MAAVPARTTSIPGRDERASHREVKFTMWIEGNIAIHRLDLLLKRWRERGVRRQRRMSCGLRAMTVTKALRVLAGAANS